MGRPGFVPTLCLLEIYDRLSKGTKKSVPELEKVSAQIAAHHSNIQKRAPWFFFDFAFTPFADLDIWR
jgi:hypothetical protein